MLSRRTFLGVAAGSIVGLGATVVTRQALASNRPPSAVGAPRTRGAFSGFDPYLHRETGARADPINLIFRGDIPAATDLLQRVLGWYPVQGSAMNFIDISGVHPTAVQLGFNIENQSRYHIRLGSVIQHGGQGYVLAGVHRDDVRTCGHIGVAFDQMRDLVSAGFAQAGYPVVQLHLDNTQAGPQCDGSWTAGDGTAALIDLTRQTGAG